MWTYLELKMTCDGAVGVCTVRMNGTTVLDLSGLDTLYTSASLTRVGMGGATSAAFAMDVDDLVVMDTTGSLNNAFLGDVTVSAIYPSGAGNEHRLDAVRRVELRLRERGAGPNDDTDYNATARSTPPTSTPFPTPLPGPTSKRYNSASRRGRRRKDLAN